MAKEGVIKRRFIGQDIINELNEKYPPQCESNGVVYKTDLKYITFEPDSDIDATIVAFDVQIGFGVFNVIFYFAEEMMKDGYRVRVDGQNMQRHTFICQGKYGVPAEKEQGRAAALSGAVRGGGSLHGYPRGPLPRTRAVGHRCTGGS